MMKRIIMLLLACSLLVGAAAAAGGSGTQADPYIIITPAELQSIQNNLAAYYELGADIDMSGFSWSSIGSDIAMFTGSLDGKMHTISNLESEKGLFYTISQNAQIKNLICDNFYLSTTTRGQGALTSSYYSSGIITNCIVKNSKIYGTNTAGGIVSCCGDIYPGNIYNCKVENTLISASQYYAGGICGVFTGSYREGARDSIMDNCEVRNCIILGSEYNGGICGQGSQSSVTNPPTITIQNCDVINTIIKSTSTAGGFCGYISSSNSVVSLLNNNLVGCTISGTISSGIGRNINDNNHIVSSCTISDCTILGTTSASGITNTGSKIRISDCIVENTNLYAPTVLDIAPSGTYDSTSTASGITNVPNRYLYASGLTAAPNGATVSYTLEGQQGSTTVEATQGTAQSWAWTFGDGATSSVAEDTTHTYATPGTYSTSLTLKNYLDSTGVTVTTSGYNILPIPPTVSASTNVLQLGQSTTLSAVGTLFSTIQWQYSTDSGATWQDISGATTATYEWTPTAGVYQVRAHVTAVGTGFTADSNVLTVSVYAPPTITDVSVSPTIGQYTETIALSAEVSDSGPDATTYQWQQTPQNQNTWTNILGATTAQWIGQLTFSGATDFRLIASGTGGQTISQTISYYIALPGEIQSLSATPSVVTLPGSTTLRATGANVVSWEWQELVSGSWVTVGYGASVQESFSAEGTYTYRVQATGADGAVVTSESIEVLAGFPPNVRITSPVDGAKFDSGARIDLSATVTGTDTTWEWAFGSQSVQTGGNGQTTWVVYEIDGAYTISIKAVSLFGTDEDSIIIISGRPSRPLASTPTTELDSDGIFVLTDSLTPGQNGQPDIWGFIQGLSKPFTDIIGAWFYLALFAVPYFIIWIRQKNIIIPSILGVMFGAWVLVMLPASALPAAIGILTLAITGGLYGLYVKINNR